MQFTEAKILSEFIKTDAHRMEVQARPPMAVTNAVSWRSEGIKYKKNEARARWLSSCVPVASCVARHRITGALCAAATLGSGPDHGSKSRATLPTRSDCAWQLRGALDLRFDIAPHGLPSSCLGLGLMVQHVTCRCSWTWWRA